MNKHFKCQNSGCCCGPVPITIKEYKQIQKKVNGMDLATIYTLKSQTRGELDCIFRDTESRKCSIYNARPEICRMFGYYQDLKCPNNPKHATRSKVAGNKRIEKNANNNPVVGVLSINITWDTFLKSK